MNLLCNGHHLLPQGVMLLILLACGVVEAVYFIQVSQFGNLFITSVVLVVLLCMFWATVSCGSSLALTNLLARLGLAL